MGPWIDRECRVEEQKRVLNGPVTQEVEQPPSHEQLCLFSTHHIFIGSGGHTFNMALIF